jgi:hypothetical protein
MPATIRLSHSPVRLLDSISGYDTPSLIASRAVNPDQSKSADMAKLGTGVFLLATVFCLSAGAQTVNVMTLNQTGAQTVLQAAKESAQQRNAPSAIAVVDTAGDLLAFQRMDGVRPASAELAIEKARTAARLRRPTAEIEDNINKQNRIRHRRYHGTARRHADTR